MPRCQRRCACSRASAACFCRWPVKRWTAPLSATKADASASDTSGFTVSIRAVSTSTMRPQAIADTAWLQAKAASSAVVAQRRK